MTSPKTIEDLVAQARESSVKEQWRSRPASITDMLTLDLVVISVGDPVSKVYHMHRSSLCARDPVFNARYGPNSLFAESQSNEMKTSDQLPQSHGSLCSLALE